MRHNSKVLLDPQSLEGYSLFLYKKGRSEDLFTFFKGNSFKNIRDVENSDMESLLSFSQFDLGASRSEEGCSSDVIDFAKKLQIIGFVYQFYKFSYKSRLPAADAINTSDYKVILKEKVQPIVEETLYKIECKDEDDAKEEPRMRADDVIQLINEEQKIIEDQQTDITEYCNTSRRQVYKEWASVAVSTSVSMAALIFVSVVSFGFTVLSIPFVPAIVGGALIALMGIMLVKSNVKDLEIAEKTHTDFKCLKQDRDQASQALGKLHSFWSSDESLQRDDSKLNDQECITAASAPLNP